MLQKVFINDIQWHTIDTFKKEENEKLLQR